MSVEATRVAGAVGADDVPDPTDAEARARTALALAVRHYLGQLRRDARVSVPALLLPALGNTLATYVVPLVVADVLGSYAAGDPPTTGELVPAIGLFAGIWLAGEAVWRFGVHFLIRTETRGMGRLYKDAMREVLDKDLAFFHDNFAGALTKKAVGYSRHYEGFVDTIAFSVVANFLPLPFLAFILWRYSPWLVVGLITLTGVTFALIYPLIRRRQILVDRREVASNAVAGHVADSITNIEAVRAYARERDEAELHDRNVDDYITKTRRAWDYSNLRIDLVVSPMYVVTNSVGLLLAIALGTRGSLGIEAVFVTFAYYFNFTRVLWEFNRIYRNLEGALTEAAQFTELLLDAPAVNDPAPAPAFRPIDASVALRGVTFAHPDEPPLFEGLDLTIRSGEKVGLVGRSGGGKTTLTRLLLRFADVQEGQVLVGGHDVSAITQRDLRSMLGYVPQDPVMFHRSLADNIRFGRPGASDDEVQRAAELAHAADFIAQLPDGYATLVGERGVKLSGGQRQRIAIARAMLKDAPILVLDEATSSLDSESEDLIQDALWRLMQDRTAIVIAHRLATVRRMDRLIVLDAGQVVEQGTHEQLIARDGIYADLWARQSGGFLHAGTP